MNPYETARQRLDNAVESLKAAQKDKAEAEAYLIKAEAEWAGATYGLRQFEESPGVPLSLYRIPSLDGGPGITIPPAALKEAAT